MMTFHETSTSIFHRQHPTTIKFNEGSRLQHIASTVCYHRIEGSSSNNRKKQIKNMETTPTVTFPTPSFACRCAPTSWHRQIASARDMANHRSPRSRLVAGGRKVPCIYRTPANTEFLPI